MRILKASPGCVFTDGQTYGETVCLTDAADASVWSEISKERAEQMQASAAKAAEAEAARREQEREEEPDQ